MAVVVELDPVWTLELQLDEPANEIPGYKAVPGQVAATLAAKDTPKTARNITRLNTWAGRFTASLRTRSG
jgi:hypothetical protein